GEHVEQSDSEVEDVLDDTTRFMTCVLNRADGGANDSSLHKDEDCDFYDGYENDAYDD
ncbi:hypothetical protein Tco_1279198, partial [Tanacetum coccineum]